MSLHNINLWKRQALIGLLMATLAACGSVAQADAAPRTGNLVRWDWPDWGGPYGVLARHGMVDWSDDLLDRHGMMGGYGKHRYGGLDLSVEQMSKIDKIRDDFRKKHWELMGKKMDEVVRLRKLRNAENPDPAGIGKQYAKIQDVQRQMLELSVDAENRMEALLTMEQKDQLRKIRRRVEGRTNTSNIIGSDKSAHGQVQSRSEIFSAVSSLCKFPLPHVFGKPFDRRILLVKP